MTIAENLLQAFLHMPTNKHKQPDQKWLSRWIFKVIAEKTDVRLIDQSVNVLSYSDYTFMITEEYEYTFSDGSKLRVISDDYCDNPSAYIP